MAFQAFPVYGENDAPQTQNPSSSKILKKKKVAIVLWQGHCFWDPLAFSASLTSRFCDYWAPQSYTSDFLDS